MLLNVLQCSLQPSPPTKNDLAQSVPSAVIEKPWGRSMLGSEEGLRCQDTLNLEKLRPREGKGLLRVTQ